MIGTRTACLRSLGCALLFGLALPAMAQQDSGNAGQEQAGGDQAEARTLDAVTVTGTRIKRTEVAAALPVRVLQREEIDAQGITSAEQDRQSVVWGKGVSVRVDLGGRFVIKKHKIKKA